MNRRPANQERREMFKPDAAWLKHQHNVTSHDGLAYRSTRDASGAHVFAALGTRMPPGRGTARAARQCWPSGGERTEVLIRERF